jgi:lipoprotein-anchoring transpeptidase ErfK/SrfK
VLITSGPTATPLPDRESCDEIDGTEYRSESEQSYFTENCLPPPPPPVATPNPPAIPGPEVTGERWVLIDLGLQQASAMIGEQKLYTALVTTGKEDWETPVGTWHIVRRVANETMTSASIGAEEFYELKDVLYTQYFTTVGHALHLNYWRDDSYFGEVPSSHGCVGMRLADAEFFWRFATVGTRVTVQ